MEELISIIEVGNEEFPNTIFFTINNFSKDIILSEEFDGCEDIHNIIINRYINERFYIYSTDYIDYLVDDVGVDKYFMLATTEFNKNNINIVVYECNACDLSAEYKLVYTLSSTESNELVNKIQIAYLQHKEKMDKEII